MPDPLNELRAKVNPILASRIAGRQQEFITETRNISDEALKHGQSGGSRMALAMEAVFKKEFSSRAQLVFESAMESLDGLEQSTPIQIAEALKHFLGEHIDSIRSELSSGLKERCGKRNLENETFNTRFEMHELREEQLRSFSAQIDLWRTKQETGLKSAKKANFRALFAKLFDLFASVFKGG